jgi:hypothetical protein
VKSAGVEAGAHALSEGYAASRIATRASLLVSAVLGLLSRCPFAFQQLFDIGLEDTMVVERGTRRDALERQFSDAAADATLARDIQISTPAISRTVAFTIGYRAALRTTR